MLKIFIFETARPQQYIIDMTTSKPSLAKKIGQIGEDKGIHILDAPVSGGDIGAKKGTLTVNSYGWRTQRRSGTLKGYFYDFFQ